MIGTISVLYSHSFNPQIIFEEDNPHVIDEEAYTRRLSHLPWVTQLLSETGPEPRQPDPGECPDHYSGY